MRYTWCITTWCVNTRSCDRSGLLSSAEYRVANGLCHAGYLANQFFGNAQLAQSLGKVFHDRIEVRVVQALLDQPGMRGGHALAGVIVRSAEGKGQKAFLHPGLFRHIDTLKEVIDTIVRQNNFIEAINGCIYRSGSAKFIVQAHQRALVSPWYRKVTYRSYKLYEYFEKTTARIVQHPLHGALNLSRPQCRQIGLPGTEKTVKIERVGIILNVANFDACVGFYASLFGLRELFSKQDGDFRLTCLEFGAAYLMLETGGVASATEKTPSQTATILRFNVDDVESSFESVLKHDRDAKLIKNDWGTIIRCVDPDGNPISIRESAGFEPDRDSNCPGV